MPEAESKEYTTCDEEKIADENISDREASESHQS